MNRFGNGRISIGISSCLLGEKVRYDGGHKQDRYITGTLGRFFRFVPVCPEVGSGLPIPREAMRLEYHDGTIRLMTVKTRQDMTLLVTEYASRVVEELEAEDLCGFIFKKDSPSSGLWRVKVYDGNVPRKTGRGIFAEQVVKRFPLLPVEDEGRLNDLPIRENFIERIFAYRRWKDFRSCASGVGDLVKFHTGHKLQLLAHSPEIYRQMGNLVAEGRKTAPEDLLNAYEHFYMKALSLRATVKKNLNVLYHIFGYFKKTLSADEKKEMTGILEQYHDGFLPLIVPVTLIKHHVAKYSQQYLAGQTYLAPHPQELMLRNHS
jgi:uncharacterized protein YbgA (DUF1722 family)/uncharacterized protein YbbK (DUF523 family)